MLAAAGVTVRHALRRLRCVAARARTRRGRSCSGRRRDPPLRRRRRSSTRSSRPRRGQAALDAALADGLRRLAHPGRAARQAPAAPAPSRSPRGSSRGCSPGRCTPSTRRSAPRPSRGLLERRWSAPSSRSSGSPATTTTSPRRARPRGSRPTAPSRRPRCRPGHPTRRSRRCTVSRWARASVPALEQLAAGLPASEFRDATAGLARAALPARGDGRRQLRRRPGRAARSPRRALLRQHPPGRQAGGGAAPGARAPRRRARSTTTSTAGPRPRGVTARTSGITVGDGAALVMVEAVARARPPGAGRRRVRHPAEPGAIRPGRRSSGIAAEEPTRLSPNVLLRPAVESAMLPTVAYLGGPGELRYLALTPPVYERLGIPRQRPLPRWSGVIVEPRVDRVLEKFGVELAELFAPPGALEARLVRSQLPAEVRRGARAPPRAPLDEGYGVLERAAAEIDPTLARPTQAARQQALGGHAGHREEAGAAPQAASGDRARPARPRAHGGDPQRQAAGAGPDRGAVPRPLRPGPARPS